LPCKSQFGETPNYERFNHYQSRFRALAARRQRRKIPSIGQNRLDAPLGKRGSRRSESTHRAPLRNRRICHFRPRRTASRRPNGVA